MKTLFLGIVVIVIVGFGGLVYRNVVEHPQRPGICPMDALVCPDGTSVTRTGSAWVFPSCPPPNVSLSDMGISFAVPEGFVEDKEPSIPDSIMYANLATTSSSVANIAIRRYSVASSSSALAVIRATAIDKVSGEPVPATGFSSVTINRRQFTVVTIERSDDVVDVAYYLSRGADVLRFDAIDKGMSGSNSASINVSTLPANVALKKLLSTLQGG